MFRTNHTKLALFVSGVVLIIVGWQLAGLRNDPGADMNDRIIADTSKCVSSGMEAVVEHSYAPFGWQDEYFVVCKPPHSTALERLARQLERPKEGSIKGIESRKPINPESFEAKQKRTE